MLGACSLFQQIVDACSEQSVVEPIVSFQFFRRDPIALMDRIRRWDLPHYLAHVDGLIQPRLCNSAGMILFGNFSRPPLIL